jgi:hypothetical protein
MSKERFFNIKGYVVDRRIFQVMIVLMIIFSTIIILLSRGNTYFRFECSTDGAMVCETDFLKPLCHDTTLNGLRYGVNLADQLEIAGLCSGAPVIPGFVFEYGEKPSVFVEWSSVFIWGFVIVAIFLNHWLYNRDYQKRKDWEGEK